VECVKLLSQILIRFAIVGQIVAGMTLYSHMVIFIPGQIIVLPGNLTFVLNHVFAFSCVSTD
jgi:hypothetical protein